MKVADSYASLIRGVSQQVPQDRAPGQHTEQVNLLPDPAEGLVRRPGSLMIAESYRSTLTHANWDAYLADTNSWRSHDHSAGGKDYTILIRTKACAAYSGKLPPMIVYNRTEGVFLSIVRNAVDAALDTLELNGVQAAASVGKYLFMSVNGVPVTGSSYNQWASAGNVDLVLFWVRGGAYSRTFTVTTTNVVTNVRTSFSYTTPASSYPGVLDTSDILTADPDYTKKVNDRVNAYNREVTNWIGTASAAIQPAAIADRLRAAALIAGVAAYGQVGSHVVFTQVKAIEVSDGGDGSLIRGVASEIESADQVSALHAVGKVVRVRSKNASEAYYLKAVAKDPQATGYTEVTWVEAAGTVHSITGGFFYGSISGSTMYLASSATLLSAILAGTHPAPVASTVGDADSAPMPFFIGREVTYLGTFQNRLLVGANGVIACSKTEDYLNFFRSTVLTLPGNDPFEMQAQGDEGDVIRHSALYDRDLIIFGDKRQYAISGSTALTPTTASMPVMTTYADTTDSPPVAVGGYLFYTKSGAKFSSLHQVQPGKSENSPESFVASSQIPAYLMGKVIETIATSGSPDTVYIRTSGQRDNVHYFSYLDKPDGRKLDSWGRWTFGVGIIIGFAQTASGLIVFSLRKGDADKVWVVADRVPSDPGLSQRPYLDSLRPWAIVSAGTGSITPTSTGNLSAAYGAGSGRRFSGSTLANVADLQAANPGEPDLWVGIDSAAYVELTSPFMRDGKDKAIMSGRLTVTRLLVAFKESTGFVSALVRYKDAAATETTFNGRVLGDLDNTIGVEPISTGQRSVSVGAEARKYSITIKARKWFPLNITAIEWVGQFFNRIQRF